MESQKMSDSLREAQSNPAFKALVWVSSILLMTCISTVTFIFTARGVDDKEGRVELAKSIDGLRTDLQSFRQTVQDQQMSVTLLQTRVSALEAASTTTRDGLSKVRDDVQGHSFRLDRVEEVMNMPRPPRH